MTTVSDINSGTLPLRDMTHLAADAIYLLVDLAELQDFIAHADGPICYKKTLGSDNVWIGDLWWAIYSYLATTGAIKGDPKSYNNGLEYLFNGVLKRLVADGAYQSDSYWRFFRPLDPLEQIARLEVSNDG